MPHLYKLIIYLVLYCHVLVPNSAYLNKPVFTQENLLFLHLATACFAQLHMHTLGGVLGLLVHLDHLVLVERRAASLLNQL